MDLRAVFVSKFLNGLELHFNLVEENEIGDVFTTQRVPLVIQQQFRLRFERE